MKLRLGVMTSLETEEEEEEEVTNCVSKNVPQKLTFCYIFLFKKKRIG